MADRLSSMSRFAEPDEREPKMLARCHYCKDALYQGDDAYRLLGNTYCSESCVEADSGLEKITLGEWY